MVDLDVTVECSSGTYIRALARDLGDALGVGGHLTALRRTHVGPYSLDQARTLEQLAEELEVLEMSQAARALMPNRELSAEETTEISFGRRIAAGAPAGSATQPLRSARRPRSRPTVPWWRCWLMRAASRSPCWCSRREPAGKTPAEPDSGGQATGGQNTGETSSGGQAG